jgi:hypothetical protein
MSLFPDEWLETAKREADERKRAEKASRPKGQKCSNCLHHRGHPFSPKYHYCAKGTSKHTDNGMAKTKPGGWCKLWEARQ